MKRLIILIYLFTLQNAGFSQALNFTITSITGGYSLTCNKTSLTLSVTANTGNSIQCTWSSISNGTVTGNSLIVSNPDFYTVTVLDLVTIETQTQALSISQDTIAPLASGGTETIICPPSAWSAEPGYIVFLQPSGLSPLTNCTYTWNQSISDPLNGFLTSPSEHTVVVALAGTYTCVVTNTVNGCSTSAIFHVVCTTVGLTENNSSILNGIKISPNPFYDKINISISPDFDSSTTFISIFDNLGREVFEGKIKERRKEMDLSSLSSGIYHLKITGDNSSKVFRILKQ